MLLTKIEVDFTTNMQNLEYKLKVDNEQISGEILDAKDLLPKNVNFKLSQKDLNILNPKKITLSAETISTEKNSNRGIQNIKVFGKFDTHDQKQMTLLNIFKNDLHREGVCLMLQFLDNPDKFDKAISERKLEKDVNAAVDSD
jgi:hypothetical protein